MNNRLFTLAIWLACTVMLIPDLSAMKRRFENSDSDTVQPKKIQKLSDESNQATVEETHDKIRLNSASDETNLTPALENINNVNSSESNAIHFNPVPVKKLSYSINLMWLNKKLDTDQLYIHPSLNKDDLHKNLLKPIFEWASLNQEAVINLWFDSELISPQAIENTHKLIKEMHEDNAKIAQIYLKDIRELDDVKNNSAIFSDTRIPTYFRADLARVIATYRSVYQEETDYFVYADLDVNPQSQEELFDTETQQNLEKYGIVMQHGGHLGFENSFHIVSKGNANLLEALKWLIIDLNIERAKNALQGEFYNVLNRKECDLFAPLTQIIYDSYPAMFQYFYHLEGYGILRLLNKQEYDKSSHGLKAFGLDRLILPNMFCRFEDKTPKKLLLKKGKILIPTKIVKAPRSHFG